MISDLRKFSQNEMFRHRILLLSGIVAYPAWGYLISGLDSQLSEQAPLAFALAGLLALFFGSSFLFSRNNPKLRQGLAIAAGCSLLLHTFWMAWVSHLSYPVFCGLLVLLGCVLNVLPSRKSSLIVAFTAGLFAFSTSWLDRGWIVPPVLVNAALWSTILPSLFANWTRLEHMQSLQSTQEELKILFQNIKEGLVVFDPSGKMQTVNPAAHEILGMSFEQMFEFNPLLPPWNCKAENGNELLEGAHPVARALLEKQEVRDSILGIRKVDGGLSWIKLTATPFQASAESTELSILVTFSDISEIKKSQKTIFDQQVRLEANAKYIALGEMAAGVAHEINNPLAIIMGKVFNIRRSLKGATSGETVEDSLVKINATVERIKKIVKGLQTFSSGDDQDPFENVNVKALVEEAVSFCQEKIERNNVQIRLDIEAGLTLDCRPVQISQCLINLINNACDAIEHEPQRWIQVWARSGHDLGVITVTDSGKGISKDVQSKLMQPFFTTKEVGKGTGLGLSITKGLIHAHLGRIWLNTAAANTTFVIELPLSHQNTKIAS